MADLSRAATKAAEHFAVHQERPAYTGPVNQEAKGAPAPVRLPKPIFRHSRPDGIFIEDGRVAGLLLYGIADGNIPPIREIGRALHDPALRVAGPCGHNPHPDNLLRVNPNGLNGGFNHVGHLCQHNVRPPVQRRFPGAFIDDLGLEIGDDQLHLLRCQINPHRIPAIRVDPQQRGPPAADRFPGPHLDDQPIGQEL